MDYTMPHSSDDTSIPAQPAQLAKRGWNTPSILDEDVRNTAAKSSVPTEFGNTGGPGS